MRNKLLISVCCTALIPLIMCSAFAFRVPERSSKLQTFLVPTPAYSSFPKAGYVSLDYIVKFEDVKTLSPAMRRATALLRTGRYQEAVVAFQSVQQAFPMEALAYRGENEASRFLNTLDITTTRDQQLLSAAEAHTPSSNKTYLAVLNYALGDVVMLKNYMTPIGTPPHDLGTEPKQHFLEAIRLHPNLLVAHLALAAYYEHDSQRHGTAARHEYDISLRLRTDLYQISYLHAASWDRPGYVLNRAQLQAQGVQLSADQQMMPERAIAECSALVRNHPSYAPPYYRMGSDYAFPLRDFANARHYLSVYAKIGDPTSDWWQYATAEVQTIDREAARSRG